MMVNKHPPPPPQKKVKIILTNIIAKQIREKNLLENSSPSIYMNKESGILQKYSKN